IRAGQPDFLNRHAVVHMAVTSRPAEPNPGFVHERWCEGIRIGDRYVAVFEILEQRKPGYIRRLGKWDGLWNVGAKHPDCNFLIRRQLMIEIKCHLLFVVFGRNGRAEIHTGAGSLWTRNVKLSI